MIRREMEALTDELSGERERFERLEVQMNDMMELHQNEIINIKRDMDEKEEKVLYQSEEQLVDVREHLVSLETKVTSMEHQAAQQQGCRNALTLTHLAACHSCVLTEL